MQPGLTAMGSHMPYEITQCLLPDLAKITFACLTQAMLVLDLMMQEVCKAADLMNKTRTE